MATVGSGRGSQRADDGLRAGARAKRILKWRACLPKLFPELLCQRPGDEAAKDVTHHQPSQTACRLGQSNHAAPNRSASATSWGTFAPASESAACPRSTTMASSSMSTRRCSLVHPDGPAAAPRRALRKLASRRSLQTWAGGTDRGSRLGSRGTCAADGRRAGSRSAWSVSGMAGASGGAVRAFGCRGNLSEMCERGGSVSPATDVGLRASFGGARFGSRAGRTCWAAFALSRSSCVHWPSQNKRLTAIWQFCVASKWVPGEHALTTRAGPLLLKRKLTDVQEFFFFSRTFSPDVRGPSARVQRPTGRVRTLASGLRARGRLGLRRGPRGGRAQLPHRNRLHPAAARATTPRRRAWQRQRGCRTSVGPILHMQQPGAAAGGKNLIHLCHFQGWYF